MAVYDLTQAAEDDLRHIWSYTAETWDADQADRYLKAIDNACQTLSGPMIKKWPEIDPALRSLRAEKHIVFFLNSDEFERPLIIAIYHERMDFLTRLAGRL